MKYIICFLCFFLSFTHPFAQSFDTSVKQINFPIDTITKKIKYSGTIGVGKIGADSLYRIAKWYIANYFKRKKSIFEEPDHLMMTMDGNIIPLSDSLSNFGNISFQLSIFCKNSELSYNFTNFYFQYEPEPMMGIFSVPLERIDNPDPGTFTDYTWYKIRRNAYVLNQIIIETLKIYMTSLTIKINE